MRPSRYAFAMIAITACLMTSNATAMQRQGNGECRNEVMQLCQEAGRDGIRQCVRDNFSKFSDRCQERFLAMMEQRRAEQNTYQGDYEDDEEME